MTPLLAQVTADPSAQSIKDWLGVLLYLFGVVAAILVVLVYWRQLREKPAETPQPFIVKGQKRFATWEELQAVRAEVIAIGDRFDKAVAQIRRDGEGRVAGIEQHLDALKSEIKNDNETLHSRITELLAAFAEFRGEARARLPHHP